MRIKIIGNNDCARATRNLLRQAGFAVTEFLPAEAVTHAPQAGYVITIDFASVPQDGTSSGTSSRTPADELAPANTPDPSSQPDPTTHGQPATRTGEASAMDRATADASSPACTDPASLPSPFIHFNSPIYFDSVDSALEAAILRHVTQLSPAPVVVDRPGGVVHSERELRIVVPAEDETATVAVEFGVLRGLLDLTTPPSGSVSTSASGDTSAFVPGGSGRGRGRKKWWHFFPALLLGTVLAFAGNARAFPRHAVEARGEDGAFLHLEAALLPAQEQFATGQMNLTLIGGAEVSSSLYDSGNTALKVNCVVGCGATTAFSDSSAFTAGSTSVNTISGVFNDSIAPISSGDAGALRATTDRMLFVNIGKLGGTALSGANVVDTGNTAFRVNCVTGCSASAGFADNSAFTAGTTSESNIGGVFNDGLSVLSSGDAAAARITASRAMHVNLRNSSGVEIGTASNPARIDPTGATTQPVSWSGQSVSLAGSWPYSGALGTVSLTGTLPAFASTPTVTANAGTNLNTSALALDTSVQDPLVAGGGTTAPTKIQIVGGKTNEGTPQYDAIPEGASGRSVIIEGTSGGQAVPVSGSFYQTTQPVSWSSQSVSLTGSWPYSGALGTVSLTGTLPAFAATPAVSGSGVFEVGPTTSANTASNTFFTQIGDGTHTATLNSTTYTSKYGVDVNLLGTLGTAFTTAGAVNIQGISGGTAVPVSGTFQATPQSSSTYALSAADVSATSATSVKSSGGNVWGWFGYNPNSSVCYLQFYNSSSVTVGTSVLHPFGVAPGASFNIAPGSVAMFNLSTDIYVAQSTAASGSTSTCASAMIVTILYD